MSGVATAIVVGTAVAGSTIYSAEKNSSAQKKAAKMQADTARRQLNQDERNFNRQNQQQVDMTSLLEGETTGGASGSTMLTGPQGVDRSKMNLGQSTLLGG